MPEYDNTNTFALFPNKEKKDSKDRDFGGYINIDGTEYWLSGYNRNNGVIGGTLKPKESLSEKWQDKKVVTDADEPISLDDIPF